MAEEDQDVIQHQYHHDISFYHAIHGSSTAIDRIKDVIRSYEIANACKFSVWQKPKDNHFGQHTSQKDLKNHDIMWKDRPAKTTHENALRLQFTGTPFMVIGTKTLSCHQGKDRNAAKKLKYAARRQEKQNTEHPYIEKRARATSTKKLECPVKAYIRHVVFFPDFKIDEDTKAKRRLASKKIRHQLGSDIAVKLDHRIYYELPKPDEHKYHMTGEVAGIRQRVVEGITQNICFLTNEGVTKVSEKSRHKKSPYIANCKVDIPSCDTETVISPSSSPSVHVTFPEPVECPVMSDVLHTSYLHPPDKELSLKNRIRVKCRHHMKKLSDLTYHLGDIRALQKMEKVLASLFDDVHEKANTDSGLILQDSDMIQPKIIRKRKLSLARNNPHDKKKRKLPPLPDNSVVTFGSKAEMMRKMFCVEIVPVASTPKPFFRMPEPVHVPPLPPPIPQMPVLLP